MPAEVLSGNLRSLPLLDILSMLSSGIRTGRLDLKSGARTGEIYLRDGSLVHAVTGEQMGESAIYTLMGWLQGDFNFVPDVESPEKSVAKDTQELLKEGAAQSEEWQKIKKVVPSTDIVFKLSSSGIVGAINLDAEEWRVLSHVNGAQSVAEIADALGYDEFRVAKMLYVLSQKAILEVGQRPKVMPKATINGRFFENFTHEFIELMGPLGPMIIDEAIAALGETRDSFPQDKVAMLVERVSTEIDNEKKRSRFQQIMLEMLKNIQ